jgi:hypothetical protein
MTSIIKTALLSFGLMAGAAAVAHAQSVAALPPNDTTPAQTARTLPYGSTQSFFPKPGGAEVLKEEHYQPPADYAVNKADHPYSTSIGPKPGSHSSGVDVPYHPTAADSSPSMHPYTAGAGPKPN